MEHQLADGAKFAQATEVAKGDPSGRAGPAVMWRCSGREPGQGQRARPARMVTRPVIDESLHAEVTGQKSARKVTGPSPSSGRPRSASGRSAASGSAVSRSTVGRSAASRSTPATKADRNPTEPHQAGNRPRAGQATEPHQAGNRPRAGQATEPHQAGNRPRAGQAGEPDRPARHAPPPVPQAQTQTPAQTPSPAPNPSPASPTFKRREIDYQPERKTADPGCQAGPRPGQHTRSSADWAEIAYASC